MEAPPTRNVSECIEAMMLFSMSAKYATHKVIALSVRLLSEVYPKEESLGENSLRLHNLVLKLWQLLSDDRTLGLSWLPFESHKCI